MLIRRERPEDVAAVETVVAEAFAPRAAGATPVEVGLLAELRADVGWLPHLSLVAEREDAVVGYAVCTRGHVGHRDALGLGPIGVAPGCQGTGVGQALMHAVVGAAEASGESLIALLGDRGFYARFGFEPAGDLGIESPDPAWGEHFQARRLADCPPGLAGAFRYAAPFAQL